MRAAAAAIGGHAQGRLWADPIQPDHAANAKQFANNAVSMGSWQSSDGFGQGYWPVSDTLLPLGTLCQFQNTS